MIEKIVHDYLETAMTGVMVVMEEDEHTELPFVIVEKTGGSEENHLFSSTITIRSHAKSLSETAKLNAQVKEAMKEIIILDEICRCELNADYNHTDTGRKRYRYQAVFDLMHY